MRRANPKRRRAQDARKQELHQLVTAMRENTLTTQLRPLPEVRDRIEMPLPPANKVHVFARTCSKGTITATNADTIGAYVFALSDLPGFADFSLFEQYRIVEVIVKFFPVTTQFGPSTTAVALPSVYTIIDPDDASVPLTIDIMRQYDTLQVVPNQSFFKRVLTPKAALAAYGGSVFTSFAQAPNGMWIDDASPNVQYYGLKWATSSVTVVSGTYVLYNVDATYVVECRRPK